MLSSFAADADDRFVFRRRLLILVVFCVAIMNTALLVPSEKISDSFLNTAIKVFAVIVGLSFCVVALLWMCGRIFGGAEDDDSIVDVETSRVESTYDNLSKRQKKHLDRIRSDAIQRILRNFSMKLRPENMITSRYEETAESEELLEHQIIPISDEEEGGYVARGDNNCTHVMIHLQQHDSEDDKNSLTREVPTSCAICLAEYEVSNVVSWSANPRCPHVFHEKCITKWFVSLGIRSDVSDDVFRKNVLNYRLECPCCRQEFVTIQE
uniref:RING-type domain-containing protein n=1 Tax=Skeletonema marinoi TaxID=267567 RepID=A0A7S2M1N8_9STRA|mmetsp:Transcript_33506/g.56686  ORF Transcript_33506/g.56686 Transcript_33506/m.56686 type:complete len:267 (+) Transcript_33506:148-948(+)